MSVKNVIAQFSKIDKSVWKLFRSKTSRSIWFDSDTRCKVNIDFIEEYCIRFYMFPELQDVEGYNYRIFMSDDLITVSIYTANPTVDSTSTDYDIPLYNVLTEESFFQESLISNFGDIDFEDLKVLSSLREQFIELYSENIINAN